MSSAYLVHRETRTARKAKPFESAASGFVKVDAQTPHEAIAHAISQRCAKCQKLYPPEPTADFHLCASCERDLIGERVRNGWTQSFRMPAHKSKPFRLDSIDADTGDILRRARRLYQQFHHAPEEGEVRMGGESTPVILYALMKHIERLHDYVVAVRKGKP